MTAYDTIAKFIISNVPANHIRIDAPAADPITGST